MQYWFCLAISRFDWSLNQLHLETKSDESRAETFTVWAILALEEHWVFQWMVICSAWSNPNFLVIIISFRCVKLIFRLIYCQHGWAEYIFVWNAPDDVKTSCWRVFMKLNFFSEKLLNWKALMAKPPVHLMLRAPQSKFPSPPFYWKVGRNRSTSSLNCLHG